MRYGAVNIDPEIMSGAPVFSGTRVPIQALFDYIETGETLDEFLANFPSVTKEQTIEVLDMARKTVTMEKILPVKILLDENIPTKVKFDFGEPFEIYTVRDMKWLGKKNGELLRLMDTYKFDFFVTLDKKLKDQQNLV